MTASPAEPLLRDLLQPLVPWLSDPATEEIAINRPGEVWVRQRGAFTRHVVERDLDLIDCESIAILAGALRQQDVGPEAPLLAAELPDGERLQACLVPVVPHGTIAITIRKPDENVIPPDEAAARYEDAGWNRAADERRAREMGALLALYDAGDFIPFLVGCVRARLNIFLTGATGSGKTSLEKTLVSAIDPAERLVTIEDALELVVPQPNHVRLLFQRNDLDKERIGSEMLLQACLRMRPDRVFLAEIRGKEAWTYAKEVMTGHPGSITTIHGDSAETAFRRLFTECAPAAAGIGDRMLARLLADTVDVIVPLREESGAFNKRHVGHVWFVADAARRGGTAADLLGEG
jgi:type IV secretion system protein VirB11